MTGIGVRLRSKSFYYFVVCTALWAPSALAWNNPNEGCCQSTDAKSCPLGYVGSSGGDDTYAICPSGMSDDDCRGQRNWQTNSPDGQWLSDNSLRSSHWYKYNRQGTIQMLQQEIEKARTDNSSTLNDSFRSDYNAQLDSIKSSLGTDIGDFTDDSEYSDGVCAASILSAGTVRKAIADAYSSNKRLQDKLTTGDLSINDPSGNPDNLPVPDPDPKYPFRNANLLRTYDSKPMPGADVSQKTRNYLAEQFERMARIFVAGSDQLSKDFPGGPAITPVVKGMYAGYRPDLLNSNQASGILYANYDKDYSLCDPAADRTTGGIANGGNHWFKGPGGGATAETIMGNTVSNHQCQNQQMSNNGKITPVTKAVVARGQIVNQYMRLMDTIKAVILKGAIPAESSLGVSVALCTERREKIKASRLVLHAELEKLRTGQSSSQFVECADQLDQAADGSVKMKASSAEIGSDKKMQGSSACNIAHLQNLVELQMTLEYAYCVWYVAGNYSEQNILNTSRNSSIMDELNKKQPMKLLACSKETEIDSILRGNQSCQNQSAPAPEPVHAATGLLALLLLPFTSFTAARRRSRTFLPSLVLLCTLSIASTGCDQHDAQNIKCDGSQGGDVGDDKNYNFGQVVLGVITGGIYGIVAAATGGNAPPDHFDEFNGSCETGCKALQDGLEAQRKTLTSGLKDVQDAAATNPELSPKVTDLQKQLGDLTGAYNTGLANCKNIRFTAKYCYSRAGNKCKDAAHAANREIASTTCKCDAPAAGAGLMLPTSFGTSDPETQFKMGLPAVRTLSATRKPASNLGAGNSDYATNTPQTAAATAMGTKGTTGDGTATAAARGLSDINPLSGAGGGGAMGTGSGSGLAGRGFGGAGGGSGMPVGMSDVGAGQELKAVGAAGMALVKYGQGGSGDGAFGGSAIEAAALRGDPSQQQGALGKDLFGKDGKGVGLGKAGLGAMSSGDPEDYFTRIGRDESIFHRASKRYGSTTIDWMKDDVSKGRSPMSEQLSSSNVDDRAFFEEIRRKSEQQTVKP